MYEVEITPALQWNMASLYLLLVMEQNRWDRRQNYCPP